MAKKMPEFDKVCTNCGGTFTCQQKRRRLCSDKCVRKAEGKRALARYYRNREIREMETRECRYCNEDFDTNNYHKRYCCPEHRTLDIKKRMATPEGRAKHREANKKSRLASRKLRGAGWTVAERREYGSQYYFDITKPRLQREKEARVLMEVPDKIPPPKIQGLTPEQIVRYWGRII